MIKKGFSLIEMVVAIGMLSIIGITMIQINTWLTNRTFTEKTNNQASLILQDGLEATYNILLSDWDESWVKYSENTPYHPVVPIDHWELQSGVQSGLDGKYTRKITLARICRNAVSGDWKAGTAGVSCASEGLVDDKSSKLAICEVDWTENGISHSKQANYLIARTIF